MIMSSKRNEDVTTMSSKTKRQINIVIFILLLVCMMIAALRNDIVSTVFFGFLSIMNLMFDIRDIIVDLRGGNDGEANGKV